MDSSTLIKRLETAKSSFENLEMQLADPDVASDPKQLEKIARERSRLEPLVNDYLKLQDIERECTEARTLVKESREDKEMELLAQEELQQLEFLKNELIQKLTLALLPKDPRDERSVMLEIRAGAGGSEACLWAGDLARMYERYGQKLGWNVKPISSTEADMGGFREMIISVTTLSAPAFVIKFETNLADMDVLGATFLSCLAYPKYGITAVMFFAEDLFNASMHNKSSIKLSLAGTEVD